MKYGRLFLYTETDDNDLTYFLLAQAEVMRAAVSKLHQYIQRKMDQTRQMGAQLQSIEWYNHRQVGVIQHALKHPGYKYVIAPHQKAQDVA